MCDRPSHVHHQRPRRWRWLKFYLQCAISVVTKKEAKAILGIVVVHQHRCRAFDRGRSEWSGRLFGGHAWSKFKILAFELMLSVWIESRLDRVQERQRGVKKSRLLLSLLLQVVLFIKLCLSVDYPLAMTTITITGSYRSALINWLAHKRGDHANNYQDQVEAFIC